MGNWVSPALPQSSRPGLSLSLAPLLGGCSSGSSDRPRRRFRASAKLGSDAGLFFGHALMQNVQDSVSRLEATSQTAKQTLVKFDESLDPREPTDGFLSQLGPRLLEPSAQRLPPAAILWRQDH